MSGPVRDFGFAFSGFEALDVLDRAAAHLSNRGIHLRADAEAVAVYDALLLLYSLRDELLAEVSAATGCELEAA